MLVNLHVKNLALIEEENIDFDEGLNILSGETGAGKSIILGSINAALGSKTSPDFIRSGCEYGLSEITFAIPEDKIERIKELGVISCDDGELVISRKIMANRSQIKVNGQSFTSAQTRVLAHELIDIHGQHDNESLLKPSRHLDMLDEYGGAEITRLKKEIGLKYREYRQTKEKADEFCTDEESRRREISFLEFEVNEIEEAQLKPGEDEELEEEYRKMANAEKITSGLGEVYHLMDSDAECVRDQIGRSVKIMGDLMSEDDRIETFYQALSDIESLCNDVTRDLADYMEDLTFREDEFEAVEKRLDFINRLKLKYGKTIPDILNHKEEAEQKLEFYRNFDEEKAETEELLEKQKEELNKMCDVLTEKRHEAAAALQENIVKALRDLNFLEVRFDVEFKKNEGFSANGNDSIQFLISTNPGENLQPLSKVASGGELSRIMLGFKSILAGKDEVETLIFDEIDTGISGRTAQMVSEKLSEISRNHQVICITHLPQIASMADSHYLIEKTVTDGKTTTAIAELTEEKSVEELARMLGGAKITDAVLESAWEMKKMNIYSKKVNKTEKR